MRPINERRIQLYLGLKNGFFVIGTSPTRAWILAGGRLRTSQPQGKTQR